MSLSASQTYQLSVTAVTNWATSTKAFPKHAPSNAGHLPSWPVSTDFMVFIDGTQQLTCTDTDLPYFSGRFGVNASNVNAHFTCLQANGPAASDGLMPPGLWPDCYSKFSAAPARSKDADARDSPLSRYSE